MDILVQGVVGLILLVGLTGAEVTRFSPFLHISFTILDVTVALGLLGILGMLGRIQTRRVFISPIGKGFFFLSGFFILSLLLNAHTLSQQQLVTSFLYIVRWVVYGSLFFLIAASKDATKKRVTIFLLISGMMLLLTGYVQFFFYPALRNLLYAGWDEHFYRMFGTFLDPNFFGLFLVVFCLFVLSLFLMKKKLSMKILLGVLGLLGLLGIILTYSRTAFIALAVGLLVLFWHTISFKKVVLVVGVLILLGLGVMTFVGRRAEGNDMFRLTSSRARVGDARNALIIFSKHPLFGVGFNAYRYAQYTEGFMKESPTQEDHGGSGADNSWLFVLATTGIIGFCMYVYFWKIHLDDLRRSKNSFGLATLTALWVGSLFTNGLFYPPLLVWLWIVLATTENTLQ
jgi:O-antigen ligase